VSPAELGGEMNGDTVVVPDWIKRLADDERQRDAVRAREEEAVARKADLVSVHGPRFIEELRATVARDVSTFRDEFAGEGVRDIVLEDTHSEGGFVVRKSKVPAVSLTVAPRLAAGAVGCHYHFSLPNGLPPREVRLDLIFAGDEAETLQLKHRTTAQVFATADALSEYLLEPVFTGRPR
jgi:hypothetical protein